MPNSLGPDVKPLTIGHVDHGIECTCEERDCVKCLKAIDRRTQSTEECFNCPIADGMREPATAAPVFGLQLPDVWHRGQAGHLHLRHAQGPGAGQRLLLE